MQPQISIPESFSVINHDYDFGVKGYQIAKQYIDPLKIIEDRQYAKGNKTFKPKQKATKRGSFLVDQCKLRKSVPGPNKYKLQSQWSTKTSRKIKLPDRLTQVAQLMKQQKKYKIPAPGFYKVFKSLKEMDAQKKRLSVNQPKLPQRISFLDSIQVGAVTTPGVGCYNVRNRARTQGSISKISTKPEDMRKKHALEQKKKKPKRPTSTTYSPNPANFTLFSTMTKQKRSRNWFGKTMRFKTTPTGSGVNPAKHSVIQQWRGKSAKKDRHGLEAISRRVHTSVYY